MSPIGQRTTYPAVGRQQVVAAFFRAGLLVLAGLTIVLAVLIVDLSLVQRSYFVERRGNLEGSRRHGATGYEGGVTFENIDLRSDSGLQVRLRVQLPVEASTGRVPLLLLIGGHRTGKKAVDLIHSPQGVAFAAIDYPYDGSHSLSALWQIATAIPGIQTALLDTPPALMLAMDWLSRQAWFDPGRSEIVGISLGVPFAAVAGALDQRFTRVWLIHGAADNLEWVMHAGRNRISNDFLRRLVARATLFLAYGNSFDTGYWLGEIGPRPAVVIAARDDDRVPATALEKFIESAARDGVTLIWTSGRHIGPGRANELEQLIDIVIDTVKSGSADVQGRRPPSHSKREEWRL